MIADGRLVVKGAPDAMLPAAAHGPHVRTRRWSDGGPRAPRAGHRRREMPAACPCDVGADEAEQDLELLGLLALEDPPRAGIAASPAACRKRGDQGGDGHGRPPGHGGGYRP